MVAKFSTGSSLMKSLNYNEHKVRQGVAELLSVVNYPLNAAELSFAQKLNRLQNQAALNENVKANSVHISLNFDPSEVLSNELMSEIAAMYMDGIGFANQPYLVYRHYDSGHPHLHIVSVKVASDGKRMETQNIGKNQSNEVRKEIEIAFNLVKAEDRLRQDISLLKPVNAQRISYGKSETKRAIDSVLRQVLTNYKYASQPELNAILKLYNVRAWRGNEGTSTFKHNGLLYQVLDTNGAPVGIPIKASLFAMKPTLEYLKSRFSDNAPLKEPLKKRTKTAIDLLFLRNPKITLEELIKALEKQAISVVLRQNETGRIYGITYVDHQDKVVFNGSDLGKPYSANAIQERCSSGLETTSLVNAGLPANAKTTDSESDLMDALLQQEFTGETLPYELRAKKKKKRKRLNNHQ